VFFPNPNANYPKVTCPDCGLTYVDDADWSGPAHPDRDCIRVLKERLAKVERERDQALGK